MTAAKFDDAGLLIFRSSCNAITSHAFRKCRPRFITSCARRWRDWIVAKFELFGSARCPHTSEMRDWLEDRGSDFVEYYVERDLTALHRMRELSGGQRGAPILVEDGRVVQVGWQGRTCIVDVG